MTTSCMCEHARRARAQGAAAGWLAKYAAASAQPAVSIRRVLAGAAYVLIDEVQATIARHKGGNLLAVLDELSAHALANGRVGLLGLDATARQGCHTSDLHLRSWADDWAMRAATCWLPQGRFPPHASTLRSNRRRVSSRRLRSTSPQRPARLPSASRATAAPVPCGSLPVSTGRSTTLPADQWQGRGGEAEAPTFSQGRCPCSGTSHRTGCT